MAIPSVCHSRALCNKTAECILMLSSLYDSPIILVCQHSKFFFPKLRRGQYSADSQKMYSVVMFLSFRFVLFEWKQKKKYFEKNEIKNVQKQNKNSQKRK